MKTKTRTDDLMIAAGAYAARKERMSHLPIATVACPACHGFRREPEPGHQRAEEAEAWQRWFQSGDVRFATKRKQKPIVGVGCGRAIIVAGFRCEQAIRRVEGRLSMIAGGKLLALKKKASSLPDPIDRWFRKYAGSAASGLLSFCKMHNIVKDVKIAVNLAEKCFQPSSVRLEEDIDPETDEKKMRIRLSVQNQFRQEVLVAYRDFTRQLSTIMPRDKSAFIRLSYDIS